MEKRRARKLKILDGGEPKGEPWVCYYCGQFADTIDHVIPISMLRMLAALEDVPITKKILRNRALKVWACRECNNLLSDSIQNSLSERKAYLKIRLIKKYKKILEAPDWGQDELDELGYTLRCYVSKMQEKKAHLKKRLSW